MLAASGAWASVAKPSGGVLGVVGDDDVGAGAADRGQGLEHGGALVEPAGGRGGLDHRVLAADVVGGDRHARRVLHAADDVEVGQRGLDHDHVGALLRGRAAPRAAPRRRWPGPSGSRGGRRRPASSRPPRGTGRRRPRRTWRVGEDRRVAEAVLVERRADARRRARPSCRSARSRRRPRAACDTAVRASSSTLASLSTAPSARSRPQWPWLVYSQRHRSAMTSTSGCASLIARVASWTTPSSSHASEPSSSLCGGDAEEQDGGDAERAGLARLGDGARDREAVDTRAWRRSPPGRRGPPRRRAAGRSRRGPAASRARGRAGPAVARSRRRRVCGNGTTTS